MFSKAGLRKINRFLKLRNIRRIVVYAKYLLFFTICAVFALSFLYGSKLALQLNNEVQLVKNNVEKSLQFFETSKGAQKLAGQGGFKKTESPFGELLITKQDDTEKDDEDVKELDLTLVGTFQDGGDPYAIIYSDSEKAQDIFTKDDRIFEQADLLSINSYAVKILYQGEEIVLELNEGGGKEGGSSGKSKSTDSGASSQTIYVDSSKVDAALDNLPLLLTQARAVPYFKNGKSVGLRLFAIKNGSLFQEIGLQNGDVLKDINGESLGDITQALKIFEKLKVEKSLALSMERGRKEIVYNYEIK